MNKNKYMDEIEELNTNDIASAEPIRKKKSGHKTVKSFFIIVLSVLCVVGIVLIHKLHNEAVTNTSRPSRVGRIMTPGRTNTSAAVSSTPLTPESSTDFHTGSDISASILPTSAESVKDSLTLTETKQTLFEKSETSSVLAQPIQSIQPIVSDTSVQSNYSLHDALIFKEHFIKGMSCNSDYNKLMSASKKTPYMQSVLNNLSPFCLGKDLPLHNIRETFLKDKKRALIADYQSKNPQWLAYIKALFVSVIEIRRLNPISTKPKDIIYKAQNELYHHNIIQAEKLLRTLPIIMQESMNGFFREAEIYMRADESLNELILSFEGKGE